MEDPVHQYLKTARQQITPKQFRQMHQTCEKAVDDLKTQEALVIKAIQEVDHYKVYRYLGLNSLYQYCLALGLSESQACAYIAVSRKSIECPSLQRAIENKELTISKAKTITAVMNEQNQTQWVEAASKLPRRELERQVAKVNPKVVQPESVKYLNDHILQMNIPMNESTYKLVERAQDLLSQKKQRPLSLEETIGLMASSYIEKNDPVIKAEKAHEKQVKKNKAAKASVKAKSKIKGSHSLGNVKGAGHKVPAGIRGKVFFRDKGLCQFKDTSGNACNEKRFIELHHIKPRSLGGSNTLENLISLCSAHHKLIHFRTDGS